MNRMPRHLFTLACCLLVLFSASPARAGEELPEANLPTALSSTFDHLLALVGGKGSAAFDPTQIAPLVDFVFAAADGTLYFEAAPRQDTTSAALPFTLKTDLPRLLRYAFNPAIPAQIITPSSIRRARWTSGAALLPRLWEYPPAPGRPVVIRGTEHEEITPDLVTGTYFEYDVDRTLILFSWRGRPVLVNLSRQRGRSGVGRKGAVLGADVDWDYFYSGEKGVARTGLGWVDSYMYASFSIGIFCAADDGTVRGGIFKWLNAGWAGLNLVQSRHIYDGLVRYVHDLHEVLESPRLPPPEELAGAFSLLAQLPGEQRQVFFQHYLEQLDRRYGRDQGLTRGFARLLRSAAYRQRLSREEQEAALALELMKCLLGRGCSDPQLAAACRAARNPTPSSPARIRQSPHGK